MKELINPEMNEFISKTIYSAVKKAQKEFPQNIAYRYMGFSIPYSTFEGEIEYLANCYYNIGIRKGDYVILCVPNSPVVVNSIYALNKIGAISCVIHFGSSPSEIAHYIKDMNAKLLVVFNDFYPNVSAGLNTSGYSIPIIRITPQETAMFGIRNGFPSSLPEISIPVGKTEISWSDFLKFGCHTHFEIFNDYDATAMIFYSGGTTGTSKGVMVSSYNLNTIAFQLERDSGLYPGCITSTIATIPMFHGFGFAANVHLMLATGGRVSLIPRFAPQDFAKNILEERPRVVTGIPMMMHAMINSAEMDGQDLSFIEGVFSGGDFASPELISNFNDFMLKHNSKAKFRNTYGLTETVTDFSLPDEDGGKIGSLGKANSGNEFFICKPGTDEFLPAGEPGEICCSGPSVMKGYLNNPEETALVLHSVNGKTILHTGDYGYLDKDGYLFFLNRIKRMIITRGYNVYPSEIEKLVLSNPNVKTSVCIGIKDPIKGQGIFLIIVPNDKTCDHKSLRKEIKEICHTNLAEYKMPDKILIWDTIPLTKMNKASLGDIEKIIETEYSLSKVKAKTPEQALAIALKNVLDIDDLNDFKDLDDFYSLGGTSQKIFTFLANLQAQGFTIDIKKLMTAKSKQDVLLSIEPFEDLKQETNVTITSEYWRSKEVDEALQNANIRYDKYYPTTKAQKDLLYNIILGNNFAQTAIINPTIEIDPEIVLNSAKLMATKYELLRSYFFITDKEIYTVIRNDLEFDIKYIKTDMAIKTYANMLNKKPFDLQNNYLFQVYVVDSPDGRFIVYNGSEIVADGLSLNNAFSYCAECYFKLSNKTSTMQELLKEAAEYSEYVFNYSDYLKTTLEHDNTEILSFIKKEFEGYTDSEQKLIQSRLANDTGTGRLNAIMPDKLYTQTKSFCKKYGISIYDLSRAVWVILAKKQLYSNDIAFGEILLGRDASIPNLSTAVGYFVNCIPVRIKVPDNITILELLKMIRNKSIVYSQYSFLHLSEALKAAGIQSLSAYLNFQDNDQGYSVSRTGSNIFRIEYLLDNASFPLCFNLWGKESLHFSIYFDKSIYSTKDIEILMNRIINTYDAITQKKESLVKDVHILNNYSVILY